MVGVTETREEDTAWPEVEGGGEVGAAEEQAAPMSTNNVNIGSSFLFIQLSSWSCCPYYRQGGKYGLVIFIPIL